MSANLTVNSQMDFPVGKSRLETMPNEVFKMIMKILAPEDALKGYVAKARAPYKKEVSKLLSLCLVSKSLEAHVRPIIFEKVFICRSTDLILFLRALIENPEMGQYVKNLELSTPFLRQDPAHESLNVGLLRGLDPDVDLFLPQGQGSLTSRQENGLRCNLYLKVLDKAPNVESATMNAPSWAVRGIKDRQLAAFGIASIIAHNRTAMPQATWAQLPMALTTLTIEGREKAEGLAEGLPGQISSIWCHGSNASSKLSRINLIFDDVTWFNSFPGAQWAPDGLRGRFASLTDLRLIFTSSRFSDIAIVCDSFPALKRLRIVSDYARFYLNNGKTDAMNGLSPGPARLCLTRNISKLHQLESLHLDLATVPNNSNLLGDNGGLDLSTLSSLTEVEVSFRLFVCHRRIMLATGLIYDPSLFLPQYLEKLGIMARGYEGEAGSSLTNFLRGLNRACQYGFPRLRRVQYMPFTGSPGRQTVDPNLICVCARSPHEGYCTYVPGSGATFAFLPWLPDKKFRALKRKFRQRAIRFMKSPTTGYIVTVENVTTGP